MSNSSLKKKRDQLRRIESSLKDTLEFVATPVTHPSKAVISTYNIKSKKGKQGIGRNVKAGSVKTFIKFLTQKPSTTTQAYKNIKIQRSMEKKNPDITSKMYATTKQGSNLTRRSSIRRKSGVGSSPLKTKVYTKRNGLLAVPNVKINESPIMRRRSSEKQPESITVTSSMEKKLEKKPSKLRKKNYSDAKAKAKAKRQ